MGRKLGKKRGMALATAMGAVVVIGLIISGVFFSSAQEYRAGASTLAEERAFRAAEAGLHATVNNWDNLAMGLQPVGTVTRFVYDTASKKIWDTVTVIRLNATSYQLVSSATARGILDGEARRRTGMTVRLSIPDFDPPGALTVRGAIQIGGNSLVSGFDAAPGSWANCPLGTLPVPGVVVPDDADLDLAGCTLFSCMVGSTGLSEDIAVADTALYSQYGDEDYASLTGQATVVIDNEQKVNIKDVSPAYTQSGGCDRSVMTNWGSPLRSIPAGTCESYFPVIWAKGDADLKLTGGSGQGVLLVDGDLDVSGNFEFFGPVVVRGRLRATGNAKLSGGVMVADVDDGSKKGQGKTNVSGSARITYSKCAVDQALLGALSPRRVVQRAWMELR